MTTPLPGDNTSATVLLELGKQSTHLAVIETKVDNVLKGQDDHERRLRDLENAKAKIVGAGIASGVLSGAVATLIYWALQAHR